MEKLRCRIKIQQKVKFVKKSLKIPKNINIGWSVKQRNGKGNFKKNEY